MAEDRRTVLLTVAGPDQVGASAQLFAALGSCGGRVVDVEQVTIQGQLILTCQLSEGCDPLALQEVSRSMSALGLRVGIEDYAESALRPAVPRLHVTLLGDGISGPVLGRVAEAAAEVGSNIDRIGQLARYPLTAYELLLSGGDLDRTRTSLTALGPELGVDVAVQADDVHRRSKRLVVLDVDSTLVQGEVIDELAVRAGCAAAVAAVTARAMAGELDFAESLRERVSLLAGLPVAVLDEVVGAMVLTPGARTLVTTLHQLGYAVGIVSGGFTVATDHLKALLRLDFAEANTVEVEGGLLTGRVLPPIVDRPGKAAALRRFAGSLGIDAAQTVAVGDGANDLDMLGAAGLGIAFNAKPVVRQKAAVSLNAPYLDAVLFVLGLSEREIAALAR